MHHRTPTHRSSRHLALRPLAIAAAIAGTSAAFAQEAATLGQVVVTAPAMDAPLTVTTAHRSLEQPLGLKLLQP